MIWRSNNVPLRLKLGILKSTCLCVLLYRCKTWIFTKDIISKLNAFATSCYQIMLGIKRTDRLPNERIYAITDIKPLSQTITYRQLQFLGHILRMDDLEPSKIYAMYEPPHGKRPQGSQRKLYAQQAKVWIDPTGNFSESDILRTAQDRINWKRLVVDCFAAER